MTIDSSTSDWALLAELAGDGIVVIQDDTVRFANRAIDKIIGWKPGEVVGKSFLDIFPPETRKLIVESLEHHGDSQEVLPFSDLSLLHQDGTQKSAPCAIARIDFRGGPALMIVIGRGSLFSPAAEAIGENKEWFRSMFEQSPIGIILCDSNGKVIDFNKASLDAFDIDRLHPHEAGRLFEEPDLPDWAKKELAEGKTVRYEGPFDFTKARGLVRTKAGKSGVMYLDVFITPLRLRENGPIRGYLVQLQDITERKRTQDAMRDLSRRLVEVQERERHHIARELHDEIGQVLTGVKLLVETAERQPLEKVGPTLANVRGLINEVMAAVRSLSLDLRPSVLDDLGLVPALLWHFERYTSQTGVQVSFAQSGAQKRFAPEVEIALYRIVQEGLTNVARHAGVKEVAVQLLSNEHALSLKIEDQGQGFDAGNPWIIGRTSGLLGMRERITSLGGNLTIDSAPGRGTRLITEVPIVDDGNERSATQ